jgi:hypothetical protein
MDRSAGSFKGAVLNGNAQVVRRHRNVALGQKLDSSRRANVSALPQTDINATFVTLCRWVVT